MPKMSTWQEMERTTLTSGTPRTGAQMRNGMGIPVGSTSVSTDAAERQSRRRASVLCRWCTSTTWRTPWCTCTRASGLEEEANGTSTQDVLWKISQEDSLGCGTWTSWTLGLRSPSFVPPAFVSMSHRTITGSAEGLVRLLGRCPSDREWWPTRSLGLGCAVPCWLPAPPLPSFHIISTRACAPLAVVVAPLVRYTTVGGCEAQPRTLP